MSGPETIASTVLSPSQRTRARSIRLNGACAGRRVEKDASMRFGRQRTRQVVGAADDDERKRRRQPHRDHVGRDELTETDAGVEPARPQDRPFRRWRDLHFDLGIGLAERGDQRLEDDRDDGARNGEAQTARWDVVRDRARPRRRRRAPRRRASRVRGSAGRLRSGRRCAWCEREASRRRALRAPAQPG